MVAIACGSLAPNCSASVIRPEQVDVSLAEFHVADNFAQSINPAGRIATHTFDVCNRLIETQAHDGSTNREAKTPGEPSIFAFFRVFRSFFRSFQAQSASLQKGRTAAMSVAPVSSITSRSTPSAAPPDSGMPRSSAARNASSSG